MIPKTGMTIDAYLRNAGRESDTTSQPKKFIPLKPHAGTSFSDKLDSALGYTPSHFKKNRTGLSIRDYFNQAVTAPSPRLYSNRPIGSGSFHPAGLDRSGTTSRPAEKDPMAGDSASIEGEVGAGAGAKPSGDREVLAAEIAASIQNAARKYNLSEKLIESVIRAESNFQVDAVSPAGAQGLMQLMPATAKELGVDDPFDARQNITGGASYLRQMLDRFGQDLGLALAAYNAGPGAVEKYNGKVPYRETQIYVDRVLKGASI